MELTKEELAKVKGSVEVVKTPMEEFLEEYRKFQNESAEMTRESLERITALSEATKSEIVMALAMRPRISKLYVNREADGLIESVDVSYE